MTPAYHFYVAINEQMPPSANKLYRKGMHGKIVLSSEGEAFKAVMKKAVANEIIFMQWPKAIDTIYRQGGYVSLHLAIHGDFRNAAWRPGGGNTKKGNPQSPYKKQDVSNYVKVTEDAIAEATSIDDCANWELHVYKRQGEPLVEVWYEVYLWQQS